MGINFSKFTEQVQNMIKKALADNKIDAAEVRAMNLEKNVANELMKQLVGNSMYLGDGFYSARGENSTLILLEKPTNNMFVELTDDSLSRYRKNYENAEKGLYKDGKIYLIDKNGKPIKDPAGNYVCEEVNFKETKKDVPNFFKQDGSFDITKIQDYLNTLPESDENYQTLMKALENTSREASYWSITNFAGTQKERFLKIYQAIDNHDLGQAVELMYSFFKEECEGFDENILSVIRSGLERLTGAKQAGPALYNALSWMAENIDNLVGRDKNNIGYAQRFVVGLNNADNALGDFIFSTEGLVTMGAIVTGEGLIAKTASTLAPYVGGAIHSFFAAQGFELIYDGSKKVLTGESLDKVAEGGQEIGHGLPLVISPVSKLIKNTEVIGKNINKIKEAKSIKELDNILNDILAEPMTAEERLNYCHEHYLKRLELQQENNKINKTDSKAFNIGNNTADNVILYLKSNYVSFDYIREGDKFIIRISDDTKITNSNRYDYYIFEKGQLKEKRIQAGKNELGEQNWQSHTGRSRTLNSGMNPEPITEGIEAHKAAKKLRDIEIKTINNPELGKLRAAFEENGLNLDETFSEYELKSIIASIEKDFGFKINDIINEPEVIEAFIQAGRTKFNGTAEIILNHSLISKDNKGVTKIYNLFDGFDLSLYEINELSKAVKYQDKNNILKILKNNNPDLYALLNYDAISETAQFESNIFELSMKFNNLKIKENKSPKCNIGNVNSQELLLDCDDGNLRTKIERGAPYAANGKFNVYDTEVLLKSNLATEEAIATLKQSGIDITTATQNSKFSIIGKDISYNISDIILKYEKFGISSLTSREIHAITDFCKKLYSENTYYKNTLDKLCDNNKNLQKLRGSLAAIRKELDTKLSNTSLIAGDHFIGRIADRNYLKLCSASKESFSNFVRDIEQNRDVKKLGNGSQCDITVSFEGEPLRIKIEKNNGKLILVTII